MEEMEPGSLPLILPHCKSPHTKGPKGVLGLEPVARDRKGPWGSELPKTVLEIFIEH